MRAPLWHHRVLVSLLYNEYEWVTRHPGGAMTVPTGRLAQALGTRTTHLHECLKLLYRLGLLDRLSWHSTYAIVRPAPPRGFIRQAEGAVVDV